MKIKYLILSFVLLTSCSIYAMDSVEPQRFDFYGDTINLPQEYTAVIGFSGPLSTEAIQAFYEKLDATNYQPVINALQAYKEKYKPDDWLFYQLIRKTAQFTSPKAANYERYTLYKWFLLNKLGYDARLTITPDKVLMYVRSDENIYDIPYRVHGDKKYICLNYHDYGQINFEQEKFSLVDVTVAGAEQSFSYKLTQLPNFKPQDYKEKELAFSYHDKDYHFKVKMNEQVKAILANYPVTDYQLHFNIPMSSETYNSLVPQLKEDVKEMNVRSGVDFLMRFTRYSFLYQPDKENFGKEKRLSPEQTLLYERSDCEDRVALFFYLVKEVYNLPMIVLAYPDHVTIAVAFDKPVGEPIEYNGKKYSVCEPTPQRKDTPIGKMPKRLRSETYEVAYVYNP